ncbi:MAG: hypothetical protein ACI4I7_01550 [Oscillospiraceae bacterium]
MINIKKIACLLTALAAIAAVSGCDKKEESSSVKEESSVVENSSKDDSEESIAEASNVGKYLKKAAEIYQSGNYTLKCTITSTSYDGAIKLTRVVKGDDIYQLQQEEEGSYGVISVGDNAYDFDNVCGMYKKAKSIPKNNVVEEVINQNLPVTDGHDSGAHKGYVTEQYTFTGDTYITNVNFYFDEKTGELKKYTMKYTVEGQDDITETRVIDSISSKVDESVFRLDFIDKMVDFEGMSEEQRLGFCQGICSSKGITTDMMNKLDITVDDFKTIDFDAFFNLVYTYGDKN